MRNTVFEIATCTECEREGMEVVEEICLECWDKIDAERKTFDNS